MGFAESGAVDRPFSFRWSHLNRSRACENAVQTDFGAARVDLAREGYEHLSDPGPVLAWGREHLVIGVLSGVSLSPGIAESFPGA